MHDKNSIFQFSPYLIEHHKILAFVFTKTTPYIGFHISYENIYKKKHWLLTLQKQHYTLVSIPLGTKHWLLT
jgi:hypothetical protein